MLVPAAVYFLLATGSSDSEAIKRIWLTHRSHHPEKVVINWESPAPGDSVVEYGRTPRYGHTARIDERVTLHHVEIPLPRKSGIYHYRVRTGSHQSPDATFKGYPTDVLRVAVVANWQDRPNLDRLMKDDPHLLLTAGDNIGSIWRYGSPGQKAVTKGYGVLLDAYPGLFRSIPVMPALGNHDREIRPRGKKYPPDPVYDVDATAFREFFELPGEEWKWYFDVPEFSVRFIALDLNHTSDFGTTWQSCHSFKKGSPQFEWYSNLMAKTRSAFVVTLYNERHSTIRAKEGRAWWDLIAKGSIAISGYGYFCERAEAGGFSYYNTSLNGTGDKYPDGSSTFLASENNYVLLTFRAGTKKMTVELKKLADGQVLHRREHGGRRIPGR